MAGRAQDRQEPAIEITDPTLDLLRTHWTRQAERLLATGHRMTDDDLVFCDAAGEPLWGRHLTTISLKALLRRAGLPAIRFHDLRHTFATLQLAAGTNPKIVSEVLGHKEVAITLDRYSHALPTLHTKAMARLDAMLGRGDDATPRSYDVCPVRIDIPGDPHPSPDAGGPPARLESEGDLRGRPHDGGHGECLRRAAAVGDRRARSGRGLAPVQPERRHRATFAAWPGRGMVRITRPSRAGGRLLPPVVVAPSTRVARAMSGRPTEFRGAMLERIRSAITPSQPVDVPRSYRTSLPAGVNLIERFAERVDDYRAVVRRSSERELPATVRRALEGHHVRRVITPPGLPPGWVKAVGSIELVADDPPLSHAQLDRIDGVISGCAIAIAETGTIVLDAGAGQGRRALSLLPDLLVCVVRANQVVGDVPEAVARLDPRRPLTWISGPSATSDIELNRIEGVHGPRILEVIIVVNGAGPTSGMRADN